MFLKGFCLKSCFLLSFLCGTETRNALARQALYYWTTLLILISQLFEFLLQGCTLEMLILKCLHKLSPAHPQCCFLSVFAFSFETSLHSTNWCWWCCILKPPTHMLASPYRPSEALWWSHIPYSLNRPTFNQDCFIHCLDLFSCSAFALTSFYLQFHLCSGICFQGSGYYDTHPEVLGLYRHLQPMLI